MDENLLISRRAALLGLGMSATLALPWLTDLAPAAEKDKAKDKDKDKDADKTKPSGPYGGWGKNATGGAGHPSVEVGTFKELADALKKGNAVILLKADINVPRSAGREAIQTTASNITLDGQGHTLHGDDMPPGDPDFKDGRGTGHMLKFVGGKNFIIKNLRIRNAEGSGNLCFYNRASDIVIDHVSTTGCTNKGIAIEGVYNKDGTGSFNATITHCLIAGNTRSMFFKYGGTSKITVDHCLIMKQLIRGPLCSDVKDFDVRNNIIQEWFMWGMRAEGDSSSGNFMGNLYIAPKDSPSSKEPMTHRALNLGKGGPKMFVKDNVFRNCTGVTKGTIDTPIEAPEIIPAYSTDMDKLEKLLFSDTEGAGCMPRDAVDKAYIAAKKWSITGGKAFRVPESMPAKKTD